MNNLLKITFLQLRRNYFIASLLMLCFFFMLAITSETTPYIDLKIEGYLISSFLLSHTLFGVLIVIYVGAFLFYVEISNNTLHLLIMSTGRQRAFLNKSLIVLLCSLLLVVATAIFGICTHLLINPDSSLFNHNFIYQLLSIWGFLFFWGELALVLMILFRSIILSIVVPFFLVIFEPLIYTYTKAKWLDVFLIYNQKNILSKSFDNLGNGSYIIIPDFDFPTLAWSLTYYFAALVMVMSVGSLVLKKMEIDS